MKTQSELSNSRQQNQSRWIPEQYPMEGSMNMNYEPHEYQKYATDFILTHSVAALLLDMGLGKTVITLTAVKEVCIDRAEVKRVLIIAPLRVARDQWPAEIEKWDHLKGLTYSVAIGSPEKRLAALKQDTMIHIINRENLDWMVKESGLPLNYDMIVIDELSSFKSMKSNRFKAMTVLHAHTKRIVGLTGTPSANSLLDLWAEYYVLDKGKHLGKNFYAFRDKYFRQEFDAAWAPYKLRPDARGEIGRAIKDITTSMKSIDHLIMPNQIFRIGTVTLDDGERRIYKQMRSTMVAALGDTEISSANAASLTSKLAQMANGAVYDEDGNVHHVHDQKLDALEDLIEAANGRSLLVAYCFQHDLERIQNRFPQARVIKNKQDIDDWNAGRIPVALIHPASMGYGLNLQQGGHILIWFGLTWNLEQYQQTNARLYRQGQKSKTVIIYHIVAMDTIDEDIMAALERKESTQSALMNAVKARLYK